MTTSQINVKDREIVLSRLYDAPRDLVFKVWTEPEHIKKWWGPNGFTNTIHEMNFKPGGFCSFTMRGPDGVDYPNVLKYKEIQKPSRIRYTHGSDMSDRPEEFDVTVTFEAQGEKTLVTMQSVWKTKEALEVVVKNYGALEGGKQTLGRLADYLKTINP